MVVDAGETGRRWARPRSPRRCHRSAPEGPPAPPSPRPEGRSPRRSGRGHWPATAPYRAPRAHRAHRVRRAHRGTPGTPGTGLPDSGVGRRGESAHDHRVRSRAPAVKRTAGQHRVNRGLPPALARSRPRRSPCCGAPRRYHRRMHHLTFLLSDGPVRSAGRAFGRERRLVRVLERVRRLPDLLHRHRRRLPARQVQELLADRPPPC